MSKAKVQVCQLWTYSLSPLNSLFLLTLRKWIWALNIFFLCQLAQGKLCQQRGQESHLRKLRCFCSLGSGMLAQKTPKAYVASKALSSCTKDASLASFSCSICSFSKAQLMCSCEKLPWHRAPTSKNFHSL